VRSPGGIGMESYTKESGEQLKGDSEILEMLERRGEGERV